MPSLRDGPPFHMTEMIEAEPALAERLLDAARRPLGRRRARWPRRSGRRAARGQPIVVTGCGTSEHGALAIGGDPARGAAHRRAAVAARRGRRARRRPGVRGLARGLSSAARRARDRRSATRAGRGRRTGRWSRPGRSAPTVGARHRLATGRPARRSPTSSSRPTSWTRAGATRSATSSPILAATAVGAPPHRRRRSTRRRSRDAARRRASRRRGRARPSDSRPRSRGVERLIVVGVRRGPRRRARARPEGRGGHAPAGRDARPRDAAPRPPRRHGRPDRARADPHRRGAAPTAARARAAGVLRAVAALGMHDRRDPRRRLRDAIPAALTPAGRLVVQRRRSCRAAVGRAARLGRAAAAADRAARPRSGA